MSRGRIRDGGDGKMTKRPNDKGAKVDGWIEHGGGPFYFGEWKEEAPEGSGPRFFCGEFESGFHGGELRANAFSFGSAGIGPNGLRVAIFGGEVKPLEGWRTATRRAVYFSRPAGTVGLWRLFPVLKHRAIVGKSRWDREEAGAKWGLQSLGGSVWFGRCQLGSQRRLFSVHGNAVNANASISMNDSRRFCLVGCSRIYCFTESILWLNQQKNRWCGRRWMNGSG